MVLLKGRSPYTCLLPPAGSRGGQGRQARCPQACGCCEGLAGVERDTPNLASPVAGHFYRHGAEPGTVSAGILCCLVPGSCPESSSSVTAGCVC